MNVLHLMRTYGKHGGEQQLSQLFKACDNNISETFIFVFKDIVCSALFKKISPKLSQINLINSAKQTSTAWAELIILLPILPILQIKYYNIVNKTKPNVCIVHGFQAALVSWPTALIKRKLGFAYIHRITKSKNKFAWIFNIIYYPFYKLVGNSISVTQSLALYTDPKKLMTIENGIDIDNFHSKSKIKSCIKIKNKHDNILITVGRLLPYKGQDLLIKALKEIVISHKNTYLYIVGAGNYEEELKNITNKYKLQDNVIFLGQQENIPSLLCESNYFVYASAWEGMSNSVLEAMTAGLPSVVVNAPGVSECHIDGVTGYIVRRDHRDIANAVIRLLNSNMQSKTMGEAAYKRVNNYYTIQNNRIKYNNLYKILINK